VLPASLRRQRDFWTKGIYGIGAAAVMAGVLAVIYQGRSEASAVYEDQGARAQVKVTDVQKRDRGVRDALLAAQEGEVKHKLLAERVAPGVLLAQAWGELTQRLQAAPELYLQSVKLVLEEQPNEIAWIRPKGQDKPGAGYERDTRSTEDLSLKARDARVLATLRVMANVDKPEQKYTAFVKALEENTRGLIVRIVKRLDPPKSGQDGSFDIELWPGEVLPRPDGVGRAQVLTRIKFDDEANPSAFVGLTPGGLEGRVPFSEVEAADLKRVLSDRFPGLTPEQTRSITEQAAKPATGK
jgi:hypothetical protein